MVAPENLDHFKKLKVCYIGCMAPPSGGANVQCKNISERLVSDGNDVAFIDFAQERPGKEIPEGTRRYSRGSGLRRFSRPALLLPSFLKYLWISWHHYGELLRSVRNVIRLAEMAMVVEKVCKIEGSVDVIHAHHATEAGLSGIIVARRLGLPVILNVFAAEFTDVDANIALAEQCCREADHITGISEFSVRLVREHGIDTPASITYPAVDYRLFHPDIPLEGIRKKYGVSESDKLIMFAGHFVLRKGPDILVDAMAVLRERGMSEGMKCIFCGADRGMRDELDKSVRERDLEPLVNLVGKVPFDDLVRLYASADVFVFPTRLNTEGFGLVAAEAMACGTPVIASRCGAIPEVVEHEETGLLFEPGNVRELADKIEQILSDDELRKKMSKCAATRVREKFDWARSGKLTLEVYRRVIQESSPY